MAEQLTRAYLDEALGRDAGTFRLESAGTRAVVDSPLHADSAAALAAVGINGRDFAARQLVERMALGADLTLGLTREHRRAALKLAPRGLARTFTLLEAADLVGLVPTDVDLPGATFAERCRSLVLELAKARARRSSGVRDDVLDPVAEPPVVHEEVRDVISEAVARLFGRLAEVRPAHLASGGRPERSVARLLSDRFVS